MLSSDRLASPLERSLSAIFRFLDVDSKACPLSLPAFLSLSLCLSFRGYSFGNYRCRSGTRLNAKENFTRANSSPPISSCSRYSSKRSSFRDSCAIPREDGRSRWMRFHLFVFGKRFRSRQTETRIPRESTPVFLYRP